MQERPPKPALREGLKRLFARPVQSDLDTPNQTRGATLLSGVLFAVLGAVFSLAFVTDVRAIALYSLAGFASAVVAEIVCSMYKMGIAWSQLFTGTLFFMFMSLAYLILGDGRIG